MIIGSNRIFITVFCVVVSYLIMLCHSAKNGCNKVLSELYCRVALSKQLGARYDFAPFDRISGVKFDLICILCVASFVLCALVYQCPKTVELSNYTYFLLKTFPIFD